MTTTQNIKFRLGRAGANKVHVLYGPAAIEYCAMDRNATHRRSYIRPGTAEYSTLAEAEIALAATDDPCKRCAAFA